MRQYARAQGRCSELLKHQQDEIDALKAAAVRLRATVIVRETQLAWLREDHRASDALMPTLHKRKAMSRRIDELLARIQSLMHERLRWQWRTAISSTPAAIDGERPFIATAFQHTAGEWEEPESALRFEASVAAADLVICQTGCLSHGEYWRVQDHCRRTGKTCVMVEQPDLRIVTIHRAPA